MIVNCTPHPIVVGDRTFAPSGHVPRVGTVVLDCGTMDGISVVRTEFGEVEGLPEPQFGIDYIVSGVVLAALKGSRPDVVAPDTSPASAVRNESGQIVGVKRFTR